MFFDQELVGFELVELFNFLFKFFFVHLFFSEFVSNFSLYFLNHLGKCYFFLINLKLVALNLILNFNLFVSVRFLHQLLQISRTLNELHRKLSRTDFFYLLIIIKVVPSWLALLWSQFNLSF